MEEVGWKPHLAWLQKLLYCYCHCSNVICVERKEAQM